MKSSHFKTPRTMDEGEWQTWGQAIWYDKQQYNALDKFVMLVSVWAFIVLFFIWLTA